MERNTSLPQGNPTGNASGNLPEKRPRRNCDGSLAPSTVPDAPPIQRNAAQAPQDMPPLYRTEGERRPLRIPDEMASPAPASTSSDPMPAPTSPLSPSNGTDDTAPNGLEGAMTDRSMVNDPAEDRQGAEPPPTQNMTGTGRLIFTVTTARGAIPLEGAQVTVRSHIPQNSTETNSADTGAPIGGDTWAVLYSGPDGKTETISLPAPAKSYSLEAQPAQAPLPYALYNAEVSLDNFYVQNYALIPLFDGITSVQQADLIPLPENGTSNGLTPDENRFTEGQNPSL